MDRQGTPGQPQRDVSTPPGIPNVKTYGDGVGGARFCTFGAQITEGDMVYERPNPIANNGLLSLQSW
jgi:hypothetical protein